MTLYDMVDLIVRRRGWAGLVRPTGLRYASRYAAGWTEDGVFVVKTEVNTLLLVWVEHVDLWLAARYAQHIPSGLVPFVVGRLPDDERVVYTTYPNLVYVARYGPQKLTELKLKGEL